MSKRLVKPVEIDLRDKIDIIPEADPGLELKMNRIPVIEDDVQNIIPVCEPKLNGNELKYVKRCIESNWISSAGKYIMEFEKLFAKICGTKYAISCTSGTTGLHLALATLGIGPGDEVIIPTFTMIATANAVRYTGAKPVLIDSEMRTWNIDTERIEEKINERTKVIITVHTYGHPCEMNKITELANKYEFFVIEDAAEAHGAIYKQRKIGSIGDAACFSFYANKIITTGEGGMITTNNEEFAKIAQNLRDHAFSKERHFWHKYVGYNYRITNLQAAIGLAQAERFDELVDCRIKNARLYNSLLKDVQGIRLPPETPDIKNVYWMYSILIEDDFGISRDELRKRLAKRGIETRTFFIPIHLQPIYYRDYSNEKFPVSELLCKKGMYLPSASTLDEDEIRYIVSAVKESKIK